MSTTSSKRPSLRDERRELTRRRIEEAAVDVFAQGGYAATSIDQIARAAGVGRATVYLHFTSKVDLVAGVWGDLRVRLLELYRGLAAASEVTEATLVTWLEKTFDFYVDNKTALLAVHEAIALEAEMAETYRRRMGEVAGLIGPLIVRALGVSEENAQLRASLLVMQHERFAHFWLLRDMPFDRDAAVEVLAQMWEQQVGYVDGEAPA